MTDFHPLRAVLDTNAIVASVLAKKPTSPTVEIMNRWRRGEFELLQSDDLLSEVADKLREKGISGPRVWNVLAEVRDVAAFVPVSPNDIRPVITDDPDDDLVLACAVIGRATHLVTYDAHFAALGGKYQGIEIVDALAFLHLLHQQTPL